MAKKKTQQTKSWLEKFWLPIILAVISLIGVIASALIPTLSKPDPRPALSQDFDYQVRIETQAGEPVERADVTIDIGGGAAPLTAVSDSTGIARFSIGASFSRKPGRLMVKASGYQPFSQNIDLIEDDLPKILQLQPVP